MNIIPFVPNHLLMLRPQLELQFLHDANLNILYRYAGWAKGLAHTIMKDGKILACWGHSPLRDDVAFVWVMFSADVNPYNFLHLTNLGRRWIESLLESYARLEFVTVEGFTKAERYAKLLGFECEGTCRKWDGQRDHKIWARVQ